MSDAEKRVLSQRVFGDWWMIKEFWQNRRFLAKWSSSRYEASAKLSKKKTEMYCQRYNIGHGLCVNEGVQIYHEYGADGKISMGSHVLLSAQTTIDYTGGLVVGDNVKIMRRAVILTHGHDFLHMVAPEKLLVGTNRVYRTSLVIGDNVQICTGAIILPGVGEIGANSMIAANSVVARKVPPRVIVSGNPAKIVASIPDDIELIAEVIS